MTQAETPSLEQLRERMDHIDALKRKARARLVGPPTQQTAEAVRIMDACDREWDRLRRAVRNHPDYVLEGL